MHVTVKTPSRIHLGLIDLNGELGRIYGSIGLALADPGIVLEARPADEILVEGDEAGRVEKIAKTFNEAYNVESGAEFTLKKTMPAHCGLGSGTQLALAVGSALANINKLSIPVPEIARALGRGVVSGIGMESFRKGGFIVDSGRKKDLLGDIPFAVQRIKFPEDWSFILAIPKKEGLYGGPEEEAFKKIIPAPAEIAKNICRIIQMKMLPSLLEKDIRSFGVSMMEADLEVGKYFSEVQDGVYAEEATQGIIDHMMASGAYGAGQSSWGPAVYGLIEDSRAGGLESAMKEYMHENGLSATVLRTHASNHGAEISILDD